MDETEFARLADPLLDTIAAAAEESEAGYDVDFEGGVLTIETAAGGQFVINKHAPNRQIWLSSPMSGAWHFACDPGTGEWSSTRNAAINLREVLAQDLGIDI